MLSQALARLSRHGATWEKSKPHQWTSGGAGHEPSWSMSSIAILGRRLSPDGKWLAALRCGAPTQTASCRSPRL